MASGLTRAFSGLISIKNVSNEPLRILRSWLKKLYVIQVVDQYHLISEYFLKHKNITKDCQRYFDLITIFKTNLGNLRNISFWKFILLQKQFHQSLIITKINL